MTKIGFLRFWAIPNTCLFNTQEEIDTEIYKHNEEDIEKKKQLFQRKIKTKKYYPNVLLELNFQLQGPEKQA